ncbi:MAG TPA: RNA methyltransferase [Candidatus Egerieousia sp.]|nr:RNA methyltransferase [Candidatus Egerieousia sp.]HPT05884.1 RNA methyltransferase [Candidatus Egerieousia sp.]
MAPNDDRNFITSLKNPKIKEALELYEKSKERRAKHLFVVEGVREVLDCINAGYELRTVFYCTKIISEKNFNEIKKYAIDDICFEVTEDVYGKLAYRAGTEGIAAVVKERKKRLEDINLQVKCDEKGNYQPLILVVESVEKPGNLGALLRTADACGADGVLICDELTDLYNPNLIRASLGGIFTQNVICCTNEEAYKWLKTNNIVIYTAQLQDSKLYYNTDMRRGCAIVMGSEAKGLTDFWRKAASEKIMIPMLGKLDSLNVSVSAAILCYEALRQRSSDTSKNK